jgi:hypothetical protein
MIRSADLRWFLPLMFLHLVVFALGDVFSFGWCYRFFNSPGMSYREVLECRLAPYVIQVGLAPLAEVLFPLYMWRVKRAPVPEVISTNLFCVIIDQAAVFTIITPAVIYNLYRDLIPALGAGWLIACLLFWSVFLGGALVLQTPLRERALAWLRKRQSEKVRPAGLGGASGAGGLLRTFLLARCSQILRVYGVRLLMGISSVISHYAALRALGVDLPLPLAMISVPIVVMAVFLPVSVGGYGGPQLVAWFLIVQMGRAGTADAVLAASFLWSTGFLVGRAAIGLAFIRGFWKRTFPSGYRL